MVEDVTKISQKMKKISWLGIEKKTLKNEKKTLIIIKYFRKFCFFITKSIRNFVSSSLKSSLQKYEKKVNF